MFVEESAFTRGRGPADPARRARRRASRAKLHADQLSAGGGAELAAEVGALSADHLEHVSDAGIAALAARRCRGGEPARSPRCTWASRRCRPGGSSTAGVPVAVATDFNPGSAPSYHLPLALTLACTLQRMTPAEALKGATLYRRPGVGLEQRVGSLEPGKAADFAVIDAPDVATWLYHFRPNACRMTIVDGAVRWTAGRSRSPAVTCRPRRRTVTPGASTRRCRLPHRTCRRLASKRNRLHSPVSRIVPQSHHNPEAPCHSAGGDCSFPLTLVAAPVALGPGAPGHRAG